MGMGSGSMASASVSECADSKPPCEDAGVATTARVLDVTLSAIGKSLGLWTEAGSPGPHLFDCRYAQHLLAYTINPCHRMLVLSYVHVATTVFLALLCVAAVVNIACGAVRWSLAKAPGAAYDGFTAPAKAFL